MPITKATASSVAPAAKGDLVVGSATNDAAVLGVGSNDQVLTADSSTATGLKWATPAAGGMTLLSTTTLSGATTTISGISGSYTSLVAYIFGVTNATATGTFRIAANGVTTGAYWRAVISTGSFYNQEGTNTYINLFGGNNQGRSVFNDNINAYVLQIDNYASTTALKPISASGLYEAPSVGYVGAGLSGGIKTTSAITSLVFSNSGGDLSTGTVLLYGVK